jgi:bacterioferritin-associated ferredoxin
MIVCLCRGVNDRTIESIVRNGAETVEELTDACGAGGGCGACRSAIACLIENYAAQNVVALSSGPISTTITAGAAAGATFAGSQGCSRAAQ